MWAPDQYYMRILQIKGPKTNNKWYNRKPEQCQSVYLILKNESISTDWLFKGIQAQAIAQHNSIVGIQCKSGRPSSCMMRGEVRRVRGGKGGAGALT